MIERIGIKHKGELFTLQSQPRIEVKFLVEMPYWKQGFQADTLSS